MDGHDDEATPDVRAPFRSWPLAFRSQYRTRRLAVVEGLDQQARPAFGFSQASKAREFIRFRRLTRSGSPAASVDEKRAPGRRTRAASFTAVARSGTSPSTVIINTTSNAASGNGSLSARPKTAVKLASPAPVRRCAAISNMGPCASKRVRCPAERLRAIAGLKKPGPQPTSRTWSVGASCSRRAIRPAGIIKYRNGLRSQRAYSTGYMPGLVSRCQGVACGPCGGRNFPLVIDPACQSGPSPLPAREFCPRE